MRKRNKLLINAKLAVTTLDKEKLADAAQAYLKGYVNIVVHKTVQWTVLLQQVCDALTQNKGVTVELVKERK